MYAWILTTQLHYDFCTLNTCDKSTRRQGSCTCLPYIHANTSVCSFSTALAISSIRASWPSSRVLWALTPNDDDAPWNKWTQFRQAWPSDHENNNSFVCSHSSTPVLYSLTYMFFAIFTRPNRVRCSQTSDMWSNQESSMIISTSIRAVWCLRALLLQNQSLSGSLTFTTLSYQWLWELTGGARYMLGYTWSEMYRLCVYTCLNCLLYDCMITVDGISLRFIEY